MQSAILQLRANLQAVKHLGDVYRRLNTDAPEIDATDILRAQMVNLSSALDKFMHDVVRIRIVEIFKGERNRPPNSKLDTLGIKIPNILFKDIYNLIDNSVNGLLVIEIPSIDDLIQAKTNIKQQQIATLDNLVREKLSEDSYLSSKNIENTLTIIGIGDLWRKIETYFHNNNVPETSDNIKRTLNLMYSRRNKIVHEFDFDDIGIHRQNIELQDMEENIDFVSTFCDAVFYIVTNNP